MTKPTYIYGIHDPGGEHLMVDAPGVIVYTVDVRSDPPIDFSARAAQGYRAIARLNWSHHGDGTIPPNSTEWPRFAQLCADFVTRCHNVIDFTIANEPNLTRESGRGRPFSPQEYATCYKMVYKAIKARVPTVQVAPAAIGPWSIESDVDWISYFQQVLENCTAHIDWICLHTYSRGYDPSSVTSDQKMDAPYDRFYNGFRTYQDFLAVVPTAMRQLPVHVTETNGNASWPQSNTGWVQAAYREIDSHNKQSGTQKIHSLALFRWPKFDSQWQFETKTGVHDDLRAALKEGYRVPMTQTTTTNTNNSANTATGKPNGWDMRLDQRGTRYVPATAAKGDKLWQVARGEWLDENQSQGKHHIFVDVLDEQGRRLSDIPVRFFWATGEDVRRTQDKPGENYAVDFPMFAAGWGYGVQIKDGKSDRIEGLGLGSIEAPEMGIHTSYRFIFQRMVKQGSAPVDPPGPEPIKPPVTSPASQTWQATVLPSSGLNIRRSAHTNSVIIAAAPEDANLVLRTEIPEWLSVEYNGREGYVASRYVMLTPPVDPDDNSQPVPLNTTGGNQAARMLWRQWGDHIQRLATTHNVPAATLAAVILAESSGRAFDAAGKLIVRFENHVFDDLWGKQNADRFARHFIYGQPRWTGHQWRPDNGAWRICHANNDQEHEVLQFARSLDDELALQATSMGLAQILGMGYRSAGYGTARAMYDSFAGGAEQQLTAMLRWIQNRGLIDELQRNDLYGFAYIFNGPGNAAHYAGLIEQYRAQFQGIVGA